MYNHLNNAYGISSISALEIAIDTNQNLIKRYNRLIKNNLLSLSKHYECHYYGAEYVNNTYSRSKSHETKYLINTNDSFTVKGKKPNKPLLRIENKKTLISTNVKRKYIKDHLKANGIDINKDYYRMEIKVSGGENYLVSNNTTYVSPFGEVISAYKYKQANKNITDGVKIAESQDILSLFRSQTETTKLSIDIDKLLYNVDYLYSVFFHFTNKIVTNIDKLIQPKYTKQKINTTTMTRTPRTTTDQTEYNISLTEKVLRYLLSVNMLSDEEYNDKMNDLHMGCDLLMELDLVT